MTKIELLNRTGLTCEIRELANRMMDRESLREKEAGLAGRIDALRASVQLAWDSGRRAPAGAPSGLRSFAREASRAWRASKDMRNDRAAND